MKNEDRIRRLSELLDELSEECIGRTLLVEGKKDKMAMFLLGINAEMIGVQAEGGPLKAAEKLSSEKREAVILTDWDAKGNKIAKELEQALSSLCVAYNTSLRSKLRSVCGNEIRDIESLPSFYCRLVTESERKKESINK